MGAGDVFAVFFTFSMALKWFFYRPVFSLV